MSTIIGQPQPELPIVPAEYQPDKISAYFLDLEGLLSRIDSATTYYQVLGVDRTEGQERIKSSFQQLFNLLFPPYVVSRGMPAEITSRIERAFNKASQAFATLASFARRKDYDSVLLSIASKPPAPEKRTQPQVTATRHDMSGSARASESSAAPRGGQEINIRQAPQHAQAYRESSNAPSRNNRRRCERFKLSIPARVTGYDQKNGKWNEMAETFDVSRTGLGIRLRRPVKHGMVLYITLPLPTKLRSHGFAEQSYNVYTLVRRIEPPRQGVRTVGVEFLGEHPPAGFLEKPWAIFRAKRRSGGECRRPTREACEEPVSIEYFDESMRSIFREKARTENVSRNGLRIAGTKAPAEFDLMMVSCPRLKFEGLAALRYRYRGKDQLERLCVQLVDKEWPLQKHGTG